MFLFPCIHKNAQCIQSDIENADGKDTNRENACRENTDRKSTCCKYTHGILARREIVKLMSGNVDNTAINAA